MKRTLIIENEQKLSRFYSINLLTWVGSLTVTAENALFATKYLEENKNEIDLILCKTRNGIEKSAEIIVNFVQTKNLSTPILFVGESTLNHAQYCHLSNGLEIKSVIQNAAKLLGVTAQDMAQLGVPEYFAVPLHHFEDLKYPACDVYQENENAGYTLINKALEEFPINMVESLTASGEKNLYVPKNDRLKFVSNLTGELIIRLQSDHLNDDEKISANEISHQLVREKLAVIGITDETIEICQKNMKSIVAATRKHQKLGKLMAMLLKNKSGYLYKHTQILTYICNHVIEHLDWGSKEQQDKISFIAFFHDISLTKDEYGKIRSNDELKASSFSPTEKDLINKHAQISAQLIAKYPRAPMGSDIIIKQHHGIAHGIGFSETYGANLSPMTIVFVLAEDYTDSLIDLGKNFNHKAKIIQMRERFSTQRFQKIIDLLEQLAS